MRTKTQAATTQRQLALAIQFVVSNCLCYPTTFAVRAGRGISKFPACSEAAFTVVIYWDKTFDNIQTFECCDKRQAPMKTVAGECWSKFLYLQLLCSQEPDPEVCLKTMLEPEADDDIPSDVASASDSPQGDPDRLSTI